MIDCIYITWIPTKGYIISDNSIFNKEESKIYLEKFYVPEYLVNNTNSLFTDYVLNQLRTEYGFKLENDCSVVFIGTDNYVLYDEDGNVVPENVYANLYKVYPCDLYGNPLNNYDPFYCMGYNGRFSLVPNMYMTIDNPNGSLENLSKQIVNSNKFDPNTNFIFNGIEEGYSEKYNQTTLELRNNEMIIPATFVPRNDAQYNTNIEQPQQVQQQEPRFSASINLGPLKLSATIK